LKRFFLKGCKKVELILSPALLEVFKNPILDFLPVLRFQGKKKIKSLLVNRPGNES
jgi:hypothetical protein